MGQNLWRLSQTQTDDNSAMKCIESGIAHPAFPTQCLHVHGSLE